MGSVVGTHQEEAASGGNISELLIEGSNHVSVPIMMYGLVLWMNVLV